MPDNYSLYPCALKQPLFSLQQGQYSEVLNAEWLTIMALEKIQPSACVYVHTQTQAGQKNTERESVVMACCFMFRSSHHHLLMNSEAGQLSDE